uniref:Endoplasmic reticulum transmembrane protein n=1 Tax=Lygus hesperus TaxID=30085 RepID=A0A0A9WIV2_LYGHE
MSLQWTLVASVLYAEIAMVLLLVIPFISPKKWQVFFRSRFLQVLSQQAQWYFGFLILILTLFLLDAIREMRKYSNKENHEHSHHLEGELQMSMRLFRAQRNFYISGFALFLSLVIRRLVTLISTQATLMAEREAALKQAQSATTTARGLMAQGRRSEDAQNSSNEAHQEEITKLEAQISLLEDELEKAKKDKQAVIDQAKGVETEYDRLSEEHKKLQLKLKVYGEGSGDKKDD